MIHSFSCRIWECVLYEERMFLESEHEEQKLLQLKLHFQGLVACAQLAKSFLLYCCLLPNGIKCFRKGIDIWWWRYRVLRLPSW